MAEKVSVREVANHARLDLTADEEERFGRELEEILEAFESLDDIDTEGVEPAFHPVELSNRKREDERELCLDNEEALANAENKEDGYFKGPRAT